MIFGYERTSTAHQNLGRQTFTLQEQNVDRIYSDQESGATTNRSQLQAMLSNLRQGDTVIITSMDRLSRNLKDVLNLIGKINELGATIKFIKEGWTFTPDKKADGIQTLILQIMGAINEYQLSFIHQAQAEGIARAKAAGKYKKSREKKLGIAERIQIKHEFLDYKKSISELARVHKVSRPTIYQALKSLE